MVTAPTFKFIAGTLCLDFVNTVGGRVGSNQPCDLADRIIRDKLTGFGDLVRWAELAGILTHAEARKIALSAPQAILDRAITLREALYRIAKSCIEDRTPPSHDLKVVNRELANANLHQRLIWSTGSFVWKWDSPADPDRILWSISRAAAEFLVSPALASLRQCPGEECGWMFLDTSRNRLRQWCEMRICGNRAKLRRFRQRASATVNHDVE